MKFSSTLFFFHSNICCKICHVINDDEEPRLVSFQLNSVSMYFRRRFVARKHKRFQMIPFIRDKGFPFLYASEAPTYRRAKKKKTPPTLHLPPETTAARQRHKARLRDDPRKQNRTRCAQLPRPPRRQ